MSITGNIIVKVSNGRIGQTTSPITLKTIPNSNRLDALNDVVEGTPVDGSTLIYDAAADKYVVDQLTFDNVTGSLDGGTF